MPEQFLHDRIDTPVGPMIVVADEKGALRLTWFDDGDERWRGAMVRFYPGAETRAKRNPSGFSTSLRDYFAGDVFVLDSLKVVYAGTDFQNRVWKALRTIACGTTMSYGALARQIGEPKAMRAVGLANGANPIGVVVPCHRVIGSNGTLTGYGGGLPRKRWLLDHEARHTAKDFALRAQA